LTEENKIGSAFLLYLNVYALKLSYTLQDSTVTALDSLIIPIAARQFKSSPATVEIQNTLITNEIRVTATHSFSSSNDFLFKM
jgi:hypothetical protein